MWGLLGNLVRSFLLLRDLFGYLIPGLVFVASAVYYIFPDHFANKSPLAIAKLASDAVTNWPILITLMVLFVSVLRQPLARQAPGRRWRLRH